MIGAGWILSAIWFIVEWPRPYSKGMWRKQWGWWFIVFLSVWLWACDDTRTITETEYVDRDVIVTEPYYTRTVYDENMGEFTAEQQDELRSKGYITMRLFYSTVVGVNIWSQVASGFEYDIYSATSIGARLIVGGYRIGYSDDNGATWTVGTPAALSGQIVKGLASRSTQIIGVCDGGKIIYSNDSGVGWSSAATPSFGGAPINCVASLGTRAFAGSSSGKIGYSDDGNTWYQATPCGVVNVYAIISDGSRLLVGGDGGDISYSDDNGASWTNTSPFSYNVIVTGFSIIGTRLVCSTRIGLTVGQLYYSDDSGASWTTGIGGIPVSCLTTMGQVVLAGTLDGDIYYSYDGANWIESSNPGFDGTAIRAMTSNMYRPIAAGDDGKIAYSVN